jgi:hypothetical protein
MLDPYGRTTFAPSRPDPTWPPLNWADAMGATAWDVPDLPLFRGGPRPSSMKAIPDYKSGQPVTMPTIVAGPPWLPPDPPPDHGYQPPLTQPPAAGGDANTSNSLEPAVAPPPVDARATMPRRPAPPPPRSSAPGPGRYTYNFPHEPMSMPGVDAFGRGVSRGIKDVWDTGSEGGFSAADFAARNLIPQNTTGWRRDLADWIHQNAQSWPTDHQKDNAAFNAKYGDSNAASAGRFIGEFAASGFPALKTANYAAKAAKAVEELAHLQALTKAAPLARRMLGGVVRGSAAGATSAALTSSASDEPLLDQVGRGALYGAGAEAAIPGLAGLAALSPHLAPIAKWLDHLSTEDAVGGAAGTSLARALLRQLLGEAIEKKLHGTGHEQNDRDRVSPQSTDEREMP